MFGIVLDAGRVTVPPFGVNLIHVLLLPISQHKLAGIEPGFFRDFPQRRLAQGLTRILAAGHRLPVAGMIGAFHEQHLQVGGMDHDQDRDGSFV